MNELCQLMAAMQNLSDLARQHGDAELLRVVDEEKNELIARGIQEGVMF